MFIASVKSILIFTNQKIIFRIVSNDVQAVNELIENSFSQHSRKNYEFDVRPDFTPDALSPLKDVLKFKGCGHLKVTFHHTFTDIDNVLLLDVDTILLRPVEAKGTTLLKNSYTRINRVYKFPAKTAVKCDAVF